VVLDTELRYRRINQRLATSNGHPVAAHIGRTVREMVPHLAASLEPKLQQVITTGTPLLDQEIQSTPQDRAGQTAFYLEHFYPLRNDRGAVYGINVVVEDITERRAMEQAIRELNTSLERKVETRTAELYAANTALRESEARYRTLFDNAADAIVILAANGDFLDVNATACRLYGYDREAFLQLNITATDLPEDIPQIPERLYRTLEQGAAAFEARHRTADGGRLTIEAKAVTISIDDRPCMLAIWRDITERKRAEVALREAHQRLTRVLDAMDAAVYITDIDTYELLLLNEAAKAVWGDSVGGRCYQVLHGLAHPCSSCTNDKLVDASGEPSGVYQWEFYNQRNQRWYAARDCAMRWSDGRLVRVEIATDVTAYKEAQAHIEHLAYFDSLTGLPNRVHLIEQLGQLIPASEQAQRMLAVCYLNLDEFKLLNEHNGRAFGDRILVALALRLRGSIGQDDCVARIGSDEFALLLTGLSSSFEAVEAARELLRQVNQALEIEGRRLHLSASLGLTLFPIDRAGPDALLQHAHEALFRAKGRSKGSYHLYDPIQDHQTRQRRHLYQEFGRALTNGELVLHYQPKIQLTDGQLIGFEALLRWRHPQKGLLGPDQFLRRIEDSPLELALGEWVIETALTQQRRWRQQGRHLPVSVNISPRQLQEPGFSAFLTGKLETLGPGRPTCLEIEVLEIAQLDDPLAAAKVMRACKELGVAFSLDDFGTGYASLTYFQQLPIDIVKIDRRFVLNMLDNREDRAIVEGAVRMAQTLPRPVLAEGVESLEIGQMLRQIGCQYAQGYGIAQPLPADQVLAWVSSWAKDRRWRPPPEA
jgi:diguanylate cyclase (GGDEF)-like protein/PAS domain S-box-containing protein